MGECFVWVKGGNNVTVSINILFFKKCQVGRDEKIYTNISLLFRRNCLPAPTLDNIPKVFSMLYSPLVWAMDNNLN